MLLEPEDIEELKQIHFEETGERLSDSEAIDMGRRLLQLYRLFATMLPGDNSRDLSQNNDSNVK